LIVNHPFPLLLDHY